VTDDDQLTVFAEDPSFKIAPRAVAALADEIGRADGRSQPFDIVTLQAVVHDVAFAYRGTRWVAEQGYLGADTLDKLAGPLQAVLNLLAAELNQSRLFVRLAESGFSDIVTAGKAMETTLATLAAIGRAAPEAHRGRRRGRPTAHTDLNEAYRAASQHFKTSSARRVRAAAAGGPSRRPVPTAPLGGVHLWRAQVGGSGAPETR
jgi:hypothetical protein